MQKYLSVTEAAAELGVSRQRVSKLCELGILGSTKVGKFRFPLKKSVEKYQSQIADRTARAPKQGRGVPNYLKNKE